MVMALSRCCIAALTPMAHAHAASAHLTDGAHHAHCVPFLLPRSLSSPAACSRTFRGHDLPLRLPASVRVELCRIPHRSAPKLAPTLLPTPHDINSPYSLQASALARASVALNPHPSSAALRQFQFHLLGHFAIQMAQ